MTSTSTKEDCTRIVVVWSDAWTCWNPVISGEQAASKATEETLRRELCVTDPTLAMIAIFPCSIVWNVRIAPEYGSLFWVFVAFVSIASG
jgi:hypothetical protein